MPRPEFSKRTGNATLALCLALLGAASMVYYHQRIFIPKSNEMLARRDLANGYSFGNDFYQIWLTSRAVIQAKRNPYSSEMTKEIQIGLYGRPLDPNRRSDFIDQRAFPYPAFTDLLFWPLSELSFYTARIAFFCVLLVLTIVSIPFWLQAMGWQLDWRWQAFILLLTLSSYPAMEGLYAGQSGLLVAFLAAATLAALNRGKLLLAGILLALTAIKPQVSLLPITYLLLWSTHDWGKRRRFVAGVMATVIVLVSVSLAILPMWISWWVRTVLAYRHYTTPPLIKDVITSLFPETIAEPATLLLTIIALALGLALAWQNRKADFRSSDFWLTLSILLSVAVVVLIPGQAVYDHLILVPAVFVIWRDRLRLQHSGTVPRLLLAIAVAIFLWPWAAAFAIVLARPFVSQAVFESTALLALPIRTAASLPFAVLALLLWMLRINYREQKAIS